MQTILKTALIIETSGKLSYHESAQAYNTLRLPKQILTQFPDLKNKLLNIRFKLEYFSNYSDIRKFLWESEYNNQEPPLLVYFYKKNVKE